ncbi:GNAT family N-acetyltransferase [Streptomyces sp. NA04227]|uniref:GNAT family N-acetyltransferase n=1 Tax=Streptomyces sp. NA04227 TaxID=2742136 RepID=UPI00159045B4|nr:GNAT family N-acetyltransferase [Streptomyces sp. NA04227]QKW07249.1 GNAT family N-acetyltransferase [Streptomyces sp. NA04227]
MSTENPALNTEDPAAAPSETAPSAPYTLTTGEHDKALEKQLTDGLEAFNAAATGYPDEDKALTVRVTDDQGELVGGLSAWIWGPLCGIDLLWVREDSRSDGWGSRLLRAAEQEARRRGCDRVIVSSFSFQAPAFYTRHGYVETGRSLGIPGGHADVHLFKSLEWETATPE